MMTAVTIQPVDINGSNDGVSYELQWLQLTSVSTLDMHNTWQEYRSNLLSNLTVIAGPGSSGGDSGGDCEWGEARFLYPRGY